MKCNSCGKKIEVTLLNKIVGTYIKNKKMVMCANCQSKMDRKGGG